MSDLRRVPDLLTDYLKNLHCNGMFFNFTYLDTSVQNLKCPYIRERLFNSFSQDELETEKTSNIISIQCFGRNTVKKHSICLRSVAEDSLIPLLS